MESKKLRAVGYRRVSMKEQVDGFSLDAQENNIRQYVEAQDWEFVRLYTDAGISAKKDSRRPALEEMLQDAESRRFDVIVVDKVDRFYRHLRGLLGALDQLNAWDVSFVSVQERLDFTSPWGKLTLTVLGTLAEIYIDNLRQETKKGRRQRARDGLWNGNPPYGYCRGLCSKCKEPNGEGYCPDFGKPNQGDGRTLILHPIESKVVRLVYDWYLTGEESCASIAKRLWIYPLTPDGLVARTHGHSGYKQAGKSRNDMVHRILTNLFYTGLVPYYGSRNARQAQELFPGKHPALVSREEHEKAQEIRKAFRRSPRFKHLHPTRIYPLSGILRCGYCGYRMHGSSIRDGRYCYYRDTTRTNNIGECPQEMVVAEQIEKQVSDWLGIALRNTTVDEQYAKDENALQKAQQRFTRAGELYVAGAMEHGDYLREREKYESIKIPLQENKLGANITSLQVARKKISAWQSLTPIEKKSLLQTMIEAVFIRGSVLVAIQPTSALLPFVQEENGSGVCNTRPNGIRSAQKGVPQPRPGQSPARSAQARTAAIRLPSPCRSPLRG